MDFFTELPSVKDLAQVRMRLTVIIHLRFAEGLTRREHCRATPA